jgi:hypothetical protein
MVRLAKEMTRMLENIKFHQEDAERKLEERRNGMTIMTFEACLAHKLIPR